MFNTKRLKDAEKKITYLQNEISNIKRNFIEFKVDVSRLVSLAGRNSDEIKLLNYKINHIDEFKGGEVDEVGYGTTTAASLLLEELIKRHYISKYLSKKQTG